MKVIRVLMLWILPVLTGLLFLAAGASKFAGPAWPANFARWGFPNGFYLVTGILEIAGGLALIVPRFRMVAGAVLAAVMVGAVVTTLAHGEPRFARTASIYLVALVVIVAGHWRLRAS